MAYDMKTFTAAVINLAVKGYVEVNESDGTFALRATDSGDRPLAPGEKAVMDRLFAKGELLMLDKDNYKAVMKAIAAHRRSLKRDYHRIYFMTNSTLVLPAVAIVVIAFLIVLLMQAVTLLTIVAFVACLVAIVVFLFLLRAPTQLGRKMLDKIEGFQLYLNVAEKDELALRNPPEKTPELFESYLPYALAMGVEQAWAEKFAGVFERLEAATGETYQPVWYHGNWSNASFAENMQGLADMTGSLGDAIASSATPPGSSSGAGGGGGGVGGW